MGIKQEYLHHRTGYRFGTHCCWVCIYEGEVGDAPVVLASQPTRIGDVELSGMSEYMAAEVIQRHFANGLPDLPRPLLWIEHRSNHGKRGLGRYFLLDFPTYQPLPAGTGFIRPVTLGPPRREEIAPSEISILVG